MSDWGLHKGSMKEPSSQVIEDTTLSEHDRGVLDLLSQEGNAAVTFQGLRRRLGVHQESLARALRRLQDERLIERTDDGYRVRPQGLAVARQAEEVAPSPRLPILRTVLPGKYAARQAFEGLRQRWFGTFRWYGQSEDEGGVTLSWTTPDGKVRVDARFEGVFLSVSGDVSDPSRLPEVIAAAHHLLNMASQAYLSGSQAALPGLDT